MRILHCLGKARRVIAHRNVKIAAFAIPAFIMAAYYVPAMFFIGRESFNPLSALTDYVFFLLLAVSALFLPGPPVLYCVALFMAAIIPSAVASSYIALYRQAPDAQVFNFIWETNAMETLEFIGEIFCDKASVALLSLLFSSLLMVVLIEFVLRALSGQPRAEFIPGIVASLVSLSVTAALCLSGAADSNIAYRFYRTLAQHHLDLRALENLAGSAKDRIKREDVSSAVTPGTRETYVVVIGESAARHHFSVYGYPRVTDPYVSGLVSNGEALAFNNVSATSIGTRDSLMRALTFMDQYTGLAGMKFTVVDVLNEAGFQTWWLSNNAPASDGSVLRVLSRNAGTIRFVAERKVDAAVSRSDKYHVDEEESVKKDEMSLPFDGELLKWFFEALRSPEPRKAVFVHLRGSHVKYWYRFPGAFEHFRGTGGIRRKDFLSEREIGVVNDYDNSIYYTDYILGELTEGLKREGGSSWLLYFSDHGEEVYDFKERAGRDPIRISKYMLDVPLILWMSEDYKESRGTSMFGEYLDRPCELDCMIHSILDLARVRTPLMDETKSLISASYEMPGRILLNPREMTYMSVEPQSLFNPRTAEAENRILEANGRVSNTR